jgi:hypothetical protein
MPRQRIELVDVAAADLDHILTERYPNEVISAK